MLSTLNISLQVGIKVVNQRFPLDCISSGKLLDHNDFLYRVDGAPAPILSGEAAFWTPPPSSPPPGPEKDQEPWGLDDVSSTESEISEHLADPPTANQQEPPSYPSFANNDLKQLPIDESMEPLVTLQDSPASRPKDELDEAIKESTRYADLVRALARCHKSLLTLHSPLTPLRTKKNLRPLPEPAKLTMTQLALTKSEPTAPEPKSPNCN